MDTKVYIAMGILVLLVVILVYLRWGTSKKENIEEDEEIFPDDSDVEMMEDDENDEFTIIDNQ